MKIEGKNSVRELLKTKKTIDKILIANGMRDEESKNLLNIIKSSGAKYQFADKSVLDKERAEDIRALSLTFRITNIPNSTTFCPRSTVRKTLFSFSSTGWKTRITSAASSGCANAPA